MNLNRPVSTLMRRPVRTLTMDTPVRDAARFFAEWDISGAPVLDAQGRPIGVFTLRDLALHVKAQVRDIVRVTPRQERLPETGEGIPFRKGFHLEAVDDTPVSDFMTPGILEFAPDTPVSEVVSEMAVRRVHRVFVREGRTLVGVVTSMDILQALAAERRQVGRT